MLYLLLGLFIVFHLIVIGMYFDNLLPLSKTKKIKKHTLKPQYFLYSWRYWLSFLFYINRYEFTLRKKEKL